MSQTMNNNEWIEWNWTQEKPYPETLETLVYTKHNDGNVFSDDGEAEKVGWWHESIIEESSWNQSLGGSITHYRLA